KNPKKKKKKMGSEIDEIFSRKKSKSHPNIAKPNISGTATKRHEIKRIPPPRSKGKAMDDHSESSSRSRKKTGDGLSIYTEEELGLGKDDAGGTALCPFDCDCCF
ncbi:hypothetical protein M569_11638, partial [Genlisea aurea]